VEYSFYHLNNILQRPCKKTGFFGVNLEFAQGGVDAGFPLKYRNFHLFAPLARLDRALCQQSCFQMPERGRRSRLSIQRNPR
jgi:hypothetical protein